MAWGTTTGAIFGAAIGVATELTISTLRGETSSWGDILGAATAGAIAGAIVVGTATADPTTLAVLGWGAVAGAVGGFGVSIVRQSVNSAMSGGPIHVDAGTVGTDTLAGGIGGFIGAGVGLGLSRLGGALKNIGDDMFNNFSGPRPEFAVAIDAGGALSVSQNALAKATLANAATQAGGVSKGVRSINWVN